MDGTRPVPAEAEPRTAVPPEAVLWGLFSAFGLFVVLGLALRLPGSPVQSSLAAAGSLVCGLAALRMPPARVVLVLGAATVGVAVLGNAMASNVGWFAVCALGSWCALTAPRSHTVAYLAGVLAVFGAEALWAQRDPGWTAWALGTTFSVSASLLIQHNRSLVAELRAAQAGLADRARAAERNRIAGELHDVIGHSLTVVLLHVASARMAVEHDPADAGRALVEAERLGRRTLDEVRATVGMLRLNGEAPSAGNAPLPGLPDLDALVTQFGDAGASIHCTVDGDLTLPPATVGLAVYRIVQEALTNAAKHAPGLTVRLAVTVDRGAVEVVVSNSRAGAGASARPGIGLLTMQERAEAVGGTLAVNSADQLWEIRAVFPLGRVDTREGVR
jgi:signal transduction histidine kinase